MTVEEIRGGNHEIDRFPIGMRVLAVDDDPTCLKLLERLLRKCQYQVTTTNQAKTALKMLRENRNRFDLVISDVYMPDMDGFKLLELVGLEMDLPVIMLSAFSDPKLVRKGLAHGACYFLVKPVRLEELRIIWQHLIKGKAETKSQSKSKSNNEKSDQGNESGDQNVKINRKRKDEEDDEDNGNGSGSDDPSQQKKPRVIWSIDLHKKFVNAVNELGLGKAMPRSIVDLMDVDGLTRENVASHLQKYRAYLNKISNQANKVVASGGSKDASPYMRMSPLDGLGDFTTLSSSASLPNSSTYAPLGMLGRLYGATGSTLHSLTAPPMVASHQNMIPFQEIPTSFDLDRQQYSNIPNTQLSDFSSIKQTPIFTGTKFTDYSSIDESRVHTGSSSFTDPSVLHGGQSSNFSLNQLPIGENYSYSAAVNGGFSSSIGNKATVPIEAYGGGLVGVNVQNVNQNQKSGSYSKQDYSQYSQNAFTTLASSALASGAVGLSGQVSQIRPNVGGSTLVQTEEQTKVQRGFIANGGYGLLNDRMTGMGKKEQDPIRMAGEFGYEHYGFERSV